jgi:hypothetical protein
MPHPRRALGLVTLVVIGVGLVAGAWLWRRDGLAGQAPAGRTLRLEDIPFDGAAAYRHLERICQFGPRPSGSAAMQAQQKFLVDYFEKLGGQVTLDRFRYRNPADGSPVDMANLIVVWHPQRKERILLCAHYDTRPFPDQDPVNPRGTFLGANDGASGVAVLMELAKAMPGLPGPLGVDFVLFDGEEYVFTENDRYFLGSEWFARQYVNEPPKYRYRAAVLLDMVGDSDLQIYQERNSVSWPESRPLAEAIWRTAARLGVREFIPRVKHEIRDDHLQLYYLAKIPACDVIDFDYPYWHTQQDTPQRCSPLSLAKVGWVIQEWLKNLR